MTWIEADVAKRLGITLKHDAEGREAFRQNPELQDDVFEAFTMGNHEMLMRLSYHGRSLQESGGVLRAQVMKTILTPHSLFFICRYIYSFRFTIQLLKCFTNRNSVN